MSWLSLPNTCPCQSQTVVKSFLVHEVWFAILDQPVQKGQDGCLDSRILRVDLISYLDDHLKCHFVCIRLPAMIISPGIPGHPHVAHTRHDNKSIFFFLFCPVEQLVKHCV